MIGQFSTANYAFGSTSNTTAYTISTRRDRLLVVSLISENNRTPSYVRYGGQDLTLAVSRINASLSTNIVHIYYALEETLAAAANTNITIGYSTSTTVVVHVADFYDVRQEAPYLTGYNDTGNGSTGATVTIAMEAANHMLLYTGMNSVDGTATWTPDAGFTELQDTSYASTFQCTTIWGLSTNSGNWAAHATCTSSGFCTAVAAAWRDMEDISYPIWFL